MPQCRTGWHLLVAAYLLISLRHSASLDTNLVSTSVAGSGGEEGRRTEETALDDVTMEEEPPCVNGQSFNRSCDESCVCTDGRLECRPRCPGPLVRSTLGSHDPNCYLRAEDDCCSTLICSSSTPQQQDLQGTTHSNSADDGGTKCDFKGQSYKIGEVFEVGCESRCECNSSGQVLCKPRCSEMNSTAPDSDRCLTVQDKRDPCCTILYCDVNSSEDTALDEEGEEDVEVRLVSAIPANNSAVILNFDSLSVPERVHVEQSIDNKTWTPAKTSGHLVRDLLPGQTYFFKVVGHPGAGLTIVSTTLPIASHNSSTCEYKGKTYQKGLEFYDDCEAFCVCAESGVECATFKCPTYFGLDVVDPSCLQWETRPRDFKPQPPRCCPDSVVCVNNGSCLYKGQLFENWADIPWKVSGCEVKCYCEGGKVNCSPRCPPVPASPPPELRCPGGSVPIVSHPADDNCCLHWICPSNTGKDGTDNSTPPPFQGPFNPDYILNKNINHKAKQMEEQILQKFPVETQIHDSILKNKSQQMEEHILQNFPVVPNIHDPIQNKTEPKEKHSFQKLPVKESQFHDSIRNKTKAMEEQILQRFPVETYIHDSVRNKTKEMEEQILEKFPVEGSFIHMSPKNSIPQNDKFPFIVPSNPYFVRRPPTSKNASVSHEIPIGVINPDKLPVGEEEFHHLNPSLLEHLLEYHHAQNSPGNYNGTPTGHHYQNSLESIVRLPPHLVPHGYPIFGESPQHQAKPIDQSNSFYGTYHSEKPGARPDYVKMYNTHSKRPLTPDTHSLTPGPHSLNPSPHSLTPGPYPVASSPHPLTPHPEYISPEELYLVESKDRLLQHPYLQQHAGLKLQDIHGTGKQSEETTDPRLHFLYVQPHNYGQEMPGHPPADYPSHHPAQERNAIKVHTLEAVDERTVRLVFSVPNVLVGLHGRVELRYTADTKNVEPSTWEQKVLAPPNDLIATPELEFYLEPLLPDTEYKIKITVVMRDLHNSPASQILTVRTPPPRQPPVIQIDAELRVSELKPNSATLTWRKFHDSELQFIDGVQLRYKEIDGKVYQATPLIHRAVTTYTIEDLKPDSHYEVGIFLIPFPGQTTELQAQKTVHLSTTVENDPYKFEVTLEVDQIKSNSVEAEWSGVPYPEDKYVHIYRAIYQYEGGREDMNTFKAAKRDSPSGTSIQGLKPDTRYRMWVEAYLTNGKIKKSNVINFITKKGGASSPFTPNQGKLESASLGGGSDYYGPLVGVSIVAGVAILTAAGLLVVLARKHGHNKAPISSPPQRKATTAQPQHTAAYDNPTYKSCEGEVGGRSPHPFEDP